MHLRATGGVCSMLSTDKLNSPEQQHMGGIKIHTPHQTRRYIYIRIRNSKDFFVLFRPVRLLREGESEWVKIYIYRGLIDIIEPHWKVN